MRWQMMVCDEKLADRWQGLVAEKMFSMKACLRKRDVEEVAEDENDSE